MKKLKLLLPLFLLIISCKSTKTTSDEPAIVIPYKAYQQRMENLEKRIYFRGNSNESDWDLKISEKSIEFTSSNPNIGTLTCNHVEPVPAMDDNAKMYRVVADTTTMIIRITQEECVNKSAYSVQLEILKNNKSTVLNGCGNYITDSRLHDIWVLEQINGMKVAITDFEKELPNLEINSTTNKFMGFSGCNQMNGTVFNERGILRFTNIATTRMFCGDNNKENEFLKTLQSTTNYKVENLLLILTNQSGSELIFKKVD